MARRNRPGRADTSVRNQPKVIRITPDGRRVVDPMSIIGSDSARRHLDEIAKIVPQRPTPGTPAPE